MTTIERHVVACAVAVPAIVVAVIFGLSGAATLIAGRPLIWPPADLTLSEAVGLRDQGEIVRQIMLGVDPNRRYAVRGVFRENETVTLTPLEAAVITRETYMVDVMRRYGAVLDQRNAATLQCLAAAMRAESMKAHLVEMSNAAADCSDINLPWHP